jgi:hypothetical protein
MCHGWIFRTTPNILVNVWQWRFKCEPSNQEKADAALEDNFTNKVRQMLHEEKAAAIKRLKKKGQMPTEVDEEGNHWPTKEALISAKPPSFGTTVGWRLLCEHWSSPAFRKISLTNSRNRLAHGETVFHCSGARSAVSTRQHLVLLFHETYAVTTFLEASLLLGRMFHLYLMIFIILKLQKLKTGKDPGITGTWLHTHNLHRGTDQEQICSERISKRWVSKIFLAYLPLVIMRTMFIANP